MDIPVAEVDESPGGDLGVVAGAAAVHDDAGILVGQHRRRETVDLVGWHVDRAREMGIGEVRRSERLDEREALAAGEAAVQVVT